MDFLISKQELVRKFKDNGASGLVVDQVGRRLPEGECRTVQDVIKRLRG